MHWLGSVSSSYGLAALALLGLLGYAALLRYRSQSLLPGMRRPTLRRTLILSLCLMATVPMVSLTVVLAERTAQAASLDASTRLSAAARAIAVATDQFLARHRDGIAEIAASAGAHQQPDAEAMADLLRLGNAVYNDFLTMLATDSDGRVIAATVVVDGEPQPAAFTGHDVSDRDYFREPMLNGDPYISAVFRGRGLGTDPIVAVSAPYQDDSGVRLGIVEGSLNLRAFDRLRQFYPLEEFDMLIIDDSLRIVYSTRPDEFPMLGSLERDTTALRLAGASAGALHAAGTASSDAYLYAAVRTSNGWSVLTRQSTAPILQRISREYSLAWAWLFGALLICILVARAIMHRVTLPLSRVAAAVEAIHFGDEENRTDPLPQTPAEVAAIFERLASLDQRLRNTYEELRESISSEAKTREALALELASREATIAIRTRELTEAKEALEQVSRTDALTGLYNRTAFMESQSLTFRVCARNGQPMALLMIDIDFFKRYNDRYGHPAGDACLVQVAQTLARCAQRPLDTVARYGGEEFIVLLGDCDAAGARAVAARFVGDVAALGLAHEDSPSGVVTLSAGLVTCEDAASADFETLLKQADQALYEAKRGGRNRFCVAAPAAAEPVCEISIKTG